jgi:hypothetical protein
MSSNTRRRSPRTVALLVALAAAGSAAALPSAASAATDTWNCSLPSGWTCAAPRHTLTSVSNYNPGGRSSGAAASRSTSAADLYGSWSYGNGWACHGYGAGNLLYPIIRNGSSVTSTFYGTSTYGSGAASC